VGRPTLYPPKASLSIFPKEIIVETLVKIVEKDDSLNAYLDKSLNLQRSSTMSGLEDS
jgi:hypothetical protein